MTDTEYRDARSDEEYLNALYNIDCNWEDEFLDDPELMAEIEAIWDEDEDESKRP